MHIRKLAIQLLDDDYGITTHTWEVLQEYLEEKDSDIVEKVKACDGRFYLHEEDAQDLKDK